MKRLSIVFTSILLYVQSVQSARILAVVPAISYSHQVFHRPLWRELTNRGHDLVFMTTIPMNDDTTNTTTTTRTKNKIRQIDLSSTFKEWQSSIQTANEIANSNKLKMAREVIDRFFAGSAYYLQHPEVQELIRNPNEKFDLIIVEFLYPAMLAFKHRFKCPLIGVFSMDAADYHHRTFGNPTHPVLYPSSLFPFAENMNFLQRIAAFTMSNIIDLYIQFVKVPEFDEIIAKYFGRDYPSSTDLAKSADMMFVNNHPLFSSVRPMSPSTVSIAGGFHVNPIKPLPRKLQNFLDKAKEGVIYFSLGSNIKSKDLSEELREVIIKTFEKFPYKVLWKFEEDDLPNKPKNVMIHKWLPQQDVLRHENVKLFITQGGLQSLDEALVARKPMVVIPHFADQESNARRVANKGLGLKLNYEALTVEEFEETILEVINNPKYKEAIDRSMDIIDDQPMKPLERAVWWTEYVLRHKGAQYLKGPQIPFYQYYYLDVIPFLLAVFAIVFAIIYFVFIWILLAIRRCFERNRRNKLKNE